MFTLFNISISPPKIDLWRKHAVIYVHPPPPVCVKFAPAKMSHSAGDFFINARFIFII